MSTLGWFIIVGIVSGLFGFGLASVLAASARQTAVDEAFQAGRDLERGIIKASFSARGRKAAQTRRANA